MHLGFGPKTLTLRLGMKQPNLLCNFTHLRPNHRLLGKKEK